MSTSNATNASAASVYSTIAVHLTQVRALTVEERLFRDALHSIQTQKTKQKKLPELFENLRHARTVEDVQYLLVTERQRNKVWSHDLAKPWLERLGKFAEYFFYYKVVLDAVVPTSREIVGPIWGAFAFVLGVLKDIPGAKQDLKNVELELEDSQSRFKRCFKPGIPLSNELEQALKRYYETVIEFAIDMHGEFARSRISTIPRLLHRTVKSKLGDLSKTIQKIINNVDQNHIIDRFDNADLKLATIGGNLQAALAAQATTKTYSSASVRGFAWGLPRSNPHFTGRGQYLRDIYARLHSSSTRQTSVATYGMGGIGKTQILQKYANDNIKSSMNPRGYDIVVYIDAHDSAAISATVSSFLQTHALGFLSSERREDKLAAFRSWITLRENWLLILDNIRDYSDVSPILPNGDAGHILCSTRHRLVAGQVADPGNSLEILGMEEHESLRLVFALAQKFPDGAESDQQTALEVVQFAKGVPLVIEQIVHNAIFGKSTLAKTLQSVRNNRQLLAQKNISSFHEENLSLGGVVMQQFKDIGRESSPAEALFMLLAYLEPSRIPVSLLRDGPEQFKEYIQRPYTFDRGQIDRTRNGTRERRERETNRQSRISFWEEADPLRPNTWAHAFRLKSAQKMQVNQSLPLDDADVVLTLQRFCGASTPLGRLFENKTMIDDAMLVLRNAAVIRPLDSDVLWMHDLVSEVARALVAERPDDTENNIGYVAAATVYLAFPIPGQNHIPAKRSACEQYLPHAIACQNQLEASGILNNSSIGPELCHIIASTMLATGFLRYDSAGYRLVEEAQHERWDRMMSYYTKAYVGYQAGWQRLKKVYGISDARIMSATLADKEHEISRRNARYYTTSRYTGIYHERFGRHSPWRAIQTALKLSSLLERNTETVDQAIQYTRIALNFHKLAFGPNDADTISVKMWLHNHFTLRVQDWPDALAIAIEGIKDLSGWNGDITALQSEDTDDSARAKILADPNGAIFASHAGYSCLEMSKRFRSENRHTEAQYRAKEAVVFLHIRLSQRQNVYGEDDNTSRQATLRLAEAYELAGQSAEAMIYYAKAIRCATHVARGTNFEFGCFEQFIMETIEAFEQAEVRLMPALIGNENIVEVKKYIGDAHQKILNWRQKQEELNATAPPRESTFNGIEPVDWEEVLQVPAEM